MQTSSHTPGPWSYSPSVACIFVEKDRTHCPQICTIPAFSGPEGDANARLIAAELLNMLTRVICELSTYDDMVKTQGEVCLCTLEHARAAIAKAKGSNA